MSAFALAPSSAASAPRPRASSKHQKPSSALQHARRVASSSSASTSTRSPPSSPGRRPSRSRRGAALRPRAGEGDDAGGSGEDDAADETSSAFQRELARRASGGRGPPEPSGSAPRRPRWASDAIRQGQREQEPPSPSDFGDPPPSMNRGGPVPEQLQNSRDLVNEGLSGLIPRARALIALGLSIPAAFGGAALATSLLFLILYLGLGEKFVHSGKPASSPPEVIDPYSLLDPYPREAPYVGFRE